MVHEAFIKYPLPRIVEDVANVGTQTKEQVMMHAHQLDLICSQVGTLYEITPIVSRSSNDVLKTKLGSHVDGVVGSISSRNIHQLAT